MKKTISLILCLVMAGALAGCGGSKEDPADQSGSDESSETVFTYASNEPIVNFDHYNTTSVECMSIGLLWGDALVYLNEDGTYGPCLATEWSWSDDNLTFTAKLRADVKFANGEALDAEDVLTTYQRFIGNNTLADGKKWSLLESVEAPDSETIVLHFSAPMATFYFECAHTPVVEADTFLKNTEEFFNKPVGTGAFQVESFEIDGDIVLTRNDSWWGWSGENKSNVDKIIYKTINEDTTRVSGVRTGELSLSKNIPADNIETLKAEGLSIINTDKYEHVYLGVNCADGHIFSNAKLRQALSLCINRELITNNLLGVGEPSIWPCMEGAIGYREASGYHYDLEKAKSLLKEAGYAGEQINFIVSSGRITRSTEVVQGIMSMMQEAGFVVSVETVENATFIDRRSAGAYDLQIGAMTFNGGDTFNELSEIIKGDRFHTSYVNEALNAVIAKGVEGVTDLEARDKASADAYQIVLDQYAPIIPLYSTVAVTAYQSNFIGFTVFRDGILDLRYLKAN